MNKLLESYAGMIDFLGKALGENVEIALHDLSSPEQEIVAISNGHISGRSIGTKLSNLSRHYLENKQYLTHDYVVNYKTAGNDGKLLKSATLFIKENNNEYPVGMLCVNVNISDYDYVKEMMKRILGIKKEGDDEVEFNRENPIEILSSPLDEMVDKYVKECLSEMGIPSYVLIERLKVDEKIKVVKYLQDKNTFKVKGAIALVAKRLGVSEPTIYRYLKKM